MAKKDNMKGQFCEDLGDWQSYLKEAEGDEGGSG